MPLKSQKMPSKRQESHKISLVSIPEILPKLVPLSGAEAFALVTWQMSRHDMTSLFVARFLTQSRPKSRQNVEKNIATSLEGANLETCYKFQQPLDVAFSQMDAPTSKGRNS